MPGRTGSKRKPGASTLTPTRERIVVPDTVVGPIGPMPRALVGYDPRALVPTFGDELSRARATAARPNRRRKTYDFDDDESDVEVTDHNRREETDDDG